MTESSRRRFSNSPISPAWGFVVLPWLWFLVRGLHPLLEFIAVLLPLFGGAAVVVALYIAASRQHLIAAMTVVSFVVFLLAAIVSPWRPQDQQLPELPATAMTVASMNVGLYWFSDNDAGFYVDRHQPDLLVGVEFSESHDVEMRSRFENSIADIISLERQQENEGLTDTTGDGTSSYKRHGLPSIGLYSNLPIERLDDPIADEIDGGLPGIRARVLTNDGPVVVYALHVPRPGLGSVLYEVSAAEHRAIVDAVISAASAEEEPVMILGDLNSVDRGQSYRAFEAEFTDGMKSDAWAVPTSDRPLPWSLLYLRPDHLFVSETLCVANPSSEDTQFADHRPIRAQVGPCPNS